MLRLEKISVRGAPRDLGRAQGEALRVRIQAFVEQRLAALRGYLAERGEAARFSEFVNTGGACLEAARRFDPEGTSEHEGIAEAAGIESSLLYAATNMTDVRDVLVLPSAADREGCTSLIVPAALTREGALISGQTWDLNPTDLDYVVAVCRRPNQGPETWSITCAGALSLMGMNADGIAVGTTNIKTRASRVGVGYLSILHRALRARKLDEALSVIRAAPRAAAHTYWAVDASGGAELECDPEAVSERKLALEPLVQTNHCQAPVLKLREGELASRSSQQRYARADTWLREGGQDIDKIRRLFADRSDGVDSINRYPEDDQGTTTNACMVCFPRQRALWACRGPADRGEWERLEFSAHAPE
jgi:isopenicillin-N N-acyltransferase-like protein